MMSTILLETRHLQKKFGRSQAVSDVSLSVKKNSIYGLLGPNGAGKSTTLKLLTGILNPSAGDILFEGRKWKRSVLKDIGSLIESPPLYDNLTAYENAKVHATLLGLPDARITEVLKLLICIIPERKRRGSFLWG